MTAHISHVYYSTNKLIRHSIANLYDALTHIPPPIISINRTNVYSNVQLENVRVSDLEMVVTPLIIKIVIIQRVIMVIKLMLIRRWMGVELVTIVVLICTVLGGVIILIVGFCIFKKYRHRLPFTA